MWPALYYNTRPSPALFSAQVTVFPLYSVVSTSAELHFAPLYRNIVRTFLVPFRGSNLRPSTWLGRLFWAFRPKREQRRNEIRIWIVRCVFVGIEFLGLVCDNHFVPVNGPYLRTGNKNSIGSVEVPIDYWISFFLVVFLIFETLVWAETCLFGYER